MKYTAVLLALGLLLSGCAINPAEDPVQIKLNDIDARLGSVERVVSNQSLVEMSRRLDALEAQLREQRGSVEVLQNGSDSERKQQRDLYADLDKRIAVLEGRLKGAAASTDTADAGPAAPAASVDAGPAGDDQAAYNHAFETLKSGNYGEAIKAFKAFMSDYPASALLDNAQYWIGEAYYVTRDYEHAAQAFRTVGERWPSSRKAPDALLKLGYTQFEQKHLADARETLKGVVQRFPGSDAARLAQERLQRLPAEAR
ncbi:MAG TPA: tol-pal system protein YbgF [Steroidobacteraceae bacterium]|nr:tol-pal system protein YbgF [Steroidobacteraceae bacterium]